MLGEIGGRRRRGRQRMRWLDGITDLMGMSLSKLREWWWIGRPGVLLFMRSQRVGHNWVTELKWTEEGSKLWARLVTESKRNWTGGKLLGDGGLVTKSCLTLATLWTVACQAPLSVGFSHGILEWVAISFSGDLPDPGIKPGSPALQADSSPTELPGMPGMLLKASQRTMICASSWWKDSLSKYFCSLSYLCFSLLNLQRMFLKTSQSI